jgi:hypothetical protein
MKHFMIKYQFANGTTEEWHREIGRFIAALTPIELIAETAP